MKWAWGLPEDTAEWAEHVSPLPTQERIRVAEEMALAWSRGELERLLGGPADPVDVRPLWHTLAAVFGALEAQGIDIEVEWWPDAIGDEVARRWCWVTPWSLICQDEDLILMDREYAVPLLQEARAGCPKAAYAVSIVEHGVRDGAFHVLASAPQRLMTHLEGLREVGVLARACGATSLHDYCDRLADYAQPGPVDQEGALLRAHDLRRCAPGVPNKIVKREGRHWQVHLAESGGADRWLVVDAGTGAMHLGSG